MIKITPYNELENRDELQRAYLMMVAASTPFLAEDVLYDIPGGPTSCNKTPKTRTRRKKGAKTKTDTAFAALLRSKGIPDGTDAPEQLLAEAMLAERIIEEYSDALHAFLYEDSAEPGRVNQKNLRNLLMLELDYGQVPVEYRFNDKRSGPRSEWPERAEALRKYVFRYDEFSQLKSTRWHWGIHKLVEELDVKVCPYCNRLFTTTVSVGGRKVRPQLDHFRNKREYPFLALSINNLVPTCGVCNLLKLDKDCDLVYPYQEDFEAEGMVFATSTPANHTVPTLEGIATSKEDFQIEMHYKQPDDPSHDVARQERIDNSIKTLCLKELYRSHRDYVAFLYRQRYILTRQLAEDLHNQFPELFGSAEEVEDVFALMHTEYEKWGDRPLAKLTHDILDEIEDLYRGVDDGASGS